MTDPRDQREYDLIIVGAGMAGSAMAYALRKTELRICILERGPAFRPEAGNWDADNVIVKRAYDPPETWINGEGQPFVPRVYYTTGGSSKFFGGSAFRLRESDFASWPIRYDELEPFYDEAEGAMWVHGRAGADPTEPPRSDYPFSPLENEPAIAWLESRLLQQGLRPFPLPVAVDQGEGGRCRKGSPCDGFPCRIRAKGDGENAFLRPAMWENKGINLITEARVIRLEHDETGKRISRVVYETASGGTEVIHANTVVLAAGAANSAALLLRSASEIYPEGLANRSGVVGRYFMSHNNTVLMALSPFRRNPTVFQKTLAINDYYHSLGNVQMRGKVTHQNLSRSESVVRRLLRKWIAARSFDLWIMSEDNPDPDNRISVDAEGTIQLRRTLNNLGPHKELVRRMRRHLRRAGLPIILRREPNVSAIQHQVGTARFGADSTSSCVDPMCKSWDIDNLYIVDGSVFPTSAAVNPALTIAANALRVGSHLTRSLIQR